MGLFDGQIKSFAKKFCEYLDERVVARVEEANKQEDAHIRSMYLTVAITLQEVSSALKTVAEL